MSIFQAVKMAFKSILGNKGRSILTMLGIIIGIASVMTIVSTVEGMNRKSMEQFEAMGTNKVTVSASLNNGRSAFDALYNYCRALGSDLVLGITPTSNFNAAVVYGSKSSRQMEKNQEAMWQNYDPNSSESQDLPMPPNLYFGSDQYSVCNNFTIASGRDISILDIRKYNQVCVMGARAARNFFGSADPVGSTIKVNGNGFTVIGTYVEKDPEGGAWSQDNVIVFPYSASRLLAPDTQMSEFAVKAASSEATTEVISRLSGFIAGLTQNGNNGWGYAYSENQWQQQQNEYLSMISMVLGGIAAISLLVGGIGIMNIMLVTVTERTREIGIRRAIGAPRRAIVAQFLIEAAMLCGLGGIIGIGIGTAGTRIAGQVLMKLEIWPAPWITGAAFALSLALGVLFGIYPAAKASRLQPVEALRAQ